MFEHLCLHGMYFNGESSIVHPMFVRTPLIDGLTKQGEFRAYLLGASEVADAVIQQVLSGYGGRLIIPSQMAILTLLRGLPQWVLRLFQARDTDVVALASH